MELKDVILSTLAEMESNETTEKAPDIKTAPEIEKKVELPKKEYKQSDDELIFLNSLREKLLVLFEGFQAPNNTNIEVKIDITLNFLEYVLASIDSRTEQLEKGRL
ncbi:MAG: hypothetical protein U9N33_10585 [Campylobacterota bacterium]|nr:hypothetical protein [Campylobacterota bacterium]